VKACFLTVVASRYRRYLFSMGRGRRSLIEWNTGGRSVVISGDTRMSKNLIEQARGADLIIHEVMAVNEELLKGSALIQQILTVHTSPEDAGILFREVEPKMAVYNHIIRIGVSDEAIVTATSKTYSGPLKVGQDLMTFVVDDEVSIINR
jgi:ribonuclease Z